MWRKLDEHHYLYQGMEDTKLVGIKTDSSGGIYVCKIFDGKELIINRNGRIGDYGRKYIIKHYDTVDNFYRAYPDPKERPVALLKEVFDNNFTASDISVTKVFYSYEEAKEELMQHLRRNYGYEEE